MKISHSLFESLNLGGPFASSGCFSSPVELVYSWKVPLLGDHREVFRNGRKLTTAVINAREVPMSDQQRLSFYWIVLQILDSAHRHLLVFNLISQPLQVSVGVVLSSSSRTYSMWIVPFLNWSVKFEPFSFSSRNAGIWGVAYQRTRKERHSWTQFLT